MCKRFTWLDSWFAALLVFCDCFFFFFFLMKWKDYPGFDPGIKGHPPLLHGLHRVLRISHFPIASLAASATLRGSLEAFRRPPRARNWRSVRSAGNELEPRERSFPRNAPASTDPGSKQNPFLLLLFGRLEIEPPNFLVEKAGKR